MSDFVIYWKNFAKDCQRYGYGQDRPLSGWRSNSKRLFTRLAPNGRLWFLVSGAVCGGEGPTAAYLVNVFRVSEVMANQGDNPDYPPEGFRYTIVADRSTCRWFQPPVFVDSVVRPAGHEITKHIGKLLQGPRQLDAACVAELERLANRDSPELKDNERKEAELILRLKAQGIAETRDPTAIPPPVDFRPLQITDPPLSETILAERR